MTLPLFHFWLKIPDFVQELHILETQAETQLN